jgi:hypothetical protein
VTQAFKWLALGLAAAGIATLSLVATASVSSPLLSLAVAAAVFVLLLPLGAYLIIRRGRTENR